MIKDDNNKITQIQEYIALWKESGQSQRNWCKEWNISYSTFKSWVIKYGPKVQHKINAQPSFIALEPSPEIHHDVQHIIIDYPNGVKISCPANLPELQLRTLFHLLA